MRLRARDDVLDVGLGCAGEPRSGVRAVDDAAHVPNDQLLNRLRIAVVVGVVRGAAILRGDLQTAPGASAGHSWCGGLRRCGGSRRRGGLRRCGGSRRRGGLWCRCGLRRRGGLWCRCGLRRRGGLWCRCGLRRRGGLWCRCGLRRRGGGSLGGGGRRCWLRCLREWSRDCLCGCHIWFGLFAEDTSDDGEANEDGSNPEGTPSSVC